MMALRNQISWLEAVNKIMRNAKKTKIKQMKKEFLHHEKWKNIWQPSRAGHWAYLFYSILFISFAVWVSHSWETFTFRGAHTQWNRISKSSVFFWIAKKKRKKKKDNLLERRQYILTQSIFLSPVCLWFVRYFQFSAFLRD